MLVVGLAAGWIASRDTLKGYVTSHRSAPIADLSMIELVDMPDWMDLGWANEVKQSVAMHVSADPFDTESLQQAANALAANPWVDHVERVVRVEHGRVQVHATYRQPIAVIRWGDDYHFVAEGMIKLPHVYRFEDLAQPCPPVIEGMRSPPPAVGQSWLGADLRAGVALADLVARQPRLLAEVSAIDVTNYNGRANPALPHLAVRFHDRPGYVLWGRPPGEEDFGERRAEEKITRLISLLDRPGLFDAGQAIDISFHRTIQRSASHINRSP